MFRISDLRHKDIVNVIDGKKLGPVKDIEVDLNEGKIMALILPGPNRMFHFLGRNEDIILDWSKIKKIGLDVVLVELNHFAKPKGKETKEEKGEMVEEIEYTQNWEIS